MTALETAIAAAHDELAGAARSLDEAGRGREAVVLRKAAKAIFVAIQGGALGGERGSFVGGCAAAFGHAADCARRARLVACATAWSRAARALTTLAHALRDPSLR